MKKRVLRPVTKRRVLKDKSPSTMADAKKNWELIKRGRKRMDKILNGTMDERKVRGTMRANEVERLGGKGFSSDVDMIRRMWIGEDRPHVEIVRKIRSMRPGVTDAYLVKVIKEADRINKVESDAKWASILENLGRDKPIMDRYKKEIDRYEKGKITKKQLNEAYEKMRKELEDREQDNWRNVNR